MRPQAPLAMQGRGAWARVAGLAAYALLCLAYLGWCWVDDLTDLGGDSAMYMLMARHLSPFHASSAVLAEAVRASAYPPLFPLLIGLCGGGMLAGHLVALAGLLTALPVLYGWLRSEGLAPAPGLWLTAVFALMPGTYLLALNIWTENPYLSFSLAALLAVSRAASGGRGSARLLWLAAAAVALATLTRAAALPLLAAFALHLVLWRPRHGLWPLALAAGPFLLWAGLGRSQQSGFSNYLAQWTQHYGQDAAAGLLRQVAGEFGRLLQAWVQAWTGSAGSGSALRGAALAIGLVCVAGWLRRLAQLRFDALYAALYAALLLSWPFPAEAERLLYVLVPVLLAQGALLLRELAAALGDGKAGALLPVYLGILSISIAPALALTAQRYALPAPGGLELVKHTPEWYGDNRLRAAPAALVMAVNFNTLRQVGAQVPAGACIFSIKPAVVTLYAERASYSPPAAAVDEAGFERGMAQCRYLYPMALVSPSFPEPFYPLGRLGGRGRTLLQAAGGDQTHWDTYGLLLDLGAAPPAAQARS